MKEWAFVLGIIILFLGGISSIITISTREASSIIWEGKDNAWSVSKYVENGTLIVVDFRPRSMSWVFEPPPEPSTGVHLSWKQIEVIVSSPSGKNASFWVVISRDPNDPRRVGVLNITVEENGGGLKLSEPLHAIQGITTETGIYTAKIGLMWPPEPPDKPPTWIGIGTETVKSVQPYISYLPVGLVILGLGAVTILYSLKGPERRRRKGTL